jgi:hypothetical protein
MNMTVTSKRKLHISRRTVFFFCFLLFIVLTSSLLVYLYLDKKIGNGPELSLDKNVGSESALRNAIDNAVEPIIIKLDKDITLTASLVIPSNKDITLTSNNNNAAKFFELIGANEQSTITVNSGGMLTLDGIIVTHESGALGSGVTVNSGGALTLLSGTISGNTAIRKGNDGVYGIGGGGVYNNGGVFTMLGGEISNNIAATDEIW